MRARRRARIPGAAAQRPGFFLGAGGQRPAAYCRRRPGRSAAPEGPGVAECGDVGAVVWVRWQGLEVDCRRLAGRGGGEEGGEGGDGVRVVLGVRAEESDGKAVEGRLAMGWPARGWKPAE